MTTNKQLRELASKATAGPWWIDSHGHRMSANGRLDTVFVADNRMGPATRHPETGNLSHWPNDWDASYIAAANPERVLALLDEIETLQAECEEELFCVRQTRDTHFGEVMRAIEQVDAMKAECNKLRKGLKINLEPYDAGLLGGDDDSPTCWWHEYIRSELAAAHDHYQAQIENNTHYLSKNERKHLLLALSCMESELPEHESLLEKLKER